MELDSKFERLVKGELQYKSANLGCNLLISRLQRKYVNESTNEVLKDCIQEMNTFFTKYKNITVTDVQNITNL